MNERLVMSQLSSNRVGSRESGESGESSSGSDESTSGSMGPSYEWVDISVRNTPTIFKKPDDLDKMIARAQSCGRVYPQIFSLLKYVGTPTVSVMEGRMLR